MLRLSIFKTAFRSHFFVKFEEADTGRMDPNAGRLLWARENHVPESESAGSG